MTKRFKSDGKNEPEYTGIKMDRELYKLAKGRARRRHQTYSEYVRQLIVRDVEKAEVAT
jgi:hypothetical protein